MSRRPPHFFRLLRRSRPRAIILLYHRITNAAPDPWALNVSPQHFDEQMEIVHRHYTPLELTQIPRTINDRQTAGRYIAITFDDGYADNLHIATPILERHNIPATIFIAAGAIGRTHAFWWDELAALLLHARPLPAELSLNIAGREHTWQLNGMPLRVPPPSPDQVPWRAWHEPPTPRHRLYAELWQHCHALPQKAQQELLTQIRAWAGNISVDATYPALTGEEVMTLAQSNCVQIGAHTINHPSLAALPQELQWQEISQSKTHLQSLINRPIYTFSYPFGKQHDFSPTTTALVQKAGYNLACSNLPGCIDRQIDPWRLPRVHVPDIGGEQFALWLEKQFDKEKVS